MIDTEGLKNIVEESKDYLDTKIELTKLKVAERSSEGISALMMFFILGTLLLLFWICLSLFFGFMLADYFDSFSKGFGVLSAIYLFFVAIVTLLRKKLLSIPIQNLIIRQIFKDDDDE